VTAEGRDIEKAGVPLAPEEEEEGDPADSANKAIGMERTKIDLRRARRSERGYEIQECRHQDTEKRMHYRNEV
jgi:hypothetical protein